MGINLSSVYVNCNDILVFTKKGNANFQTFCSESHEFQALSPGGPAPSLLRNRFLGCHATLPQRNGCPHTNNIPFTKLANHRFRSIFKNVFAPNSPFETCPIRECFLSLYPVVGDVTDKHTDFRLFILFSDLLAERYFLYVTSSFVFICRE